MLVPIIRVVAAGAALYFAYRVGVEDGKYQARWEYLKESCTSSINEMKAKATAELQELEEHLQWMENDDVDAGSSETFNRDEDRAQLLEKIKSKKAHIESLEATARAL